MRRPKIIQLHHLAHLRTAIEKAKHDRDIAAKHKALSEMGASILAGAKGGLSEADRKGLEAPSSLDPGLRYVAWHDSDYKTLDDARLVALLTPAVNDLSARVMDLESKVNDGASS
mgnify:CR=1 FL=1